ncbi:MAG: single-stranded-DNA-specific exonuclease RecJ [Candidatus Kerfeldbacteria bacterium]|nr:single-stranded-DNA-specific exonuclease RecJ [Candidatus Kerfeldbacteria bacterium]
MLTKKYQIAPVMPNEFVELFPQFDAILLQLLYNRNLKTQSKIDEYLHPDWLRDVPNPFLFQDMNLAVERIYEAIGKGEVIGVFGDYDADGVAAAIIISSTLKKLGGRTEVYLPHREREGYGLNKTAINYLRDKGANLIITCDCGITNLEQIDYAKTLKVDVIVTDHHQALNNLPEAYAIIHCGLAGETYPFKFLSGGGVAFKLIQGLLRYPGCPLPDTERESWEKWLLDLVAISTVADMVPLIGESRTLTKYGLIVLTKTKRLGLVKLINQAGINVDKIDAYTIGFQIAPRINAAGRLDHANAAYALLTSENVSEAEELARALNLTNSERQRLTEEMFNQAKEQIGQVALGQLAVQAFRPGWPLGMVGLVAGKLVQEYNLPAIVICQAGDKLAGSGRSIEQLDLVATLRHCQEYLLNYGGHKGAAGFSIKPGQLEAFVQKFKTVCAELLSSQDLTPYLNIEIKLQLNQLSLHLVESITELEPFGMNNFRPRFLSENLTILETKAVGNLGQHLRLTVRDNDGDIRKFIYFNGAANFNLIALPVDIVYEVGLNEWGGSSELELKVVDIRNHEA